jgi:hypothetical protein
MLAKSFPAFASVFKTAYLKVAAVLATLAIIGLATVGSYGISWDENVEVSMVKFNFELITQDQPIPEDYKYYGTVFNISSEVVFQVQNILRQGLNYNPLSDKDLTNERVKYQALYDRIKVKHVLTFLVSLITYASVAGIVWILCGGEYAWLGAVVAALFPRLWGHSFFNPKDIPFAALFTLSTLLGAYLVNHYLQVDQEFRLKFNRTLVYSILYGILVGLVTGVRIGGFFLLFFVGITYLICKLGSRTIFRDLRNILVYGGVMFVTWAVTVIAVHPASWSNPIGWFFATLGYLSKHGWGNTVLFAGESISAKALPWYYLPTWLIITIPLIFQVAFVVGLVLLVIKYKQFSHLQRACAILVTLQVGFLPLLAIVRDSTLYDGKRQFLFILPGMAAIAAAAIAWIYQKLNRKSFKIATMAFLITVLAAIAIDMATLHPYEYIYFNRISGGLAHAQGRYDTDYWGLSLREGMEWINENAPSNSTVVVGGDDDSALIFSDPSFTIISKFNFTPATQKPFYYLAMPRWDFQEAFPECAVSHQVIKQDVPLTIVKHCK